MMDFFGPGVAAAERIGLYPRLAAAAYRVEAAEYVDTAGRATCRLDYDRFARLAGGNVLSLLRPDMERAALAALDDVPSGRVRVRYGAPVSLVVNDDDGVRATVADAPDVTLAADVLVGADGIHSGVRAQLFGHEGEYLRPLGMRAAAFIVTDAAAERPLPGPVRADRQHRPGGRPLQPPLGRGCGPVGLSGMQLTRGSCAPGVRGSGCAGIHRTGQRSGPAARTVPGISVQRRGGADCDARLVWGGPFSWGMPAGQSRSSRGRAVRSRSPAPRCSGTSLGQ